MSEEKKLPIIAKRIRALRIGEKLTQEQFGKLFGIVKATVSSYETGNSIPDDDIKKEICKYFNISSDYLLGISDYPTKRPITEREIQIILFGQENDKLWKKTKEYIAFITNYNSNEYAEFLKNYKPKSTHSEENKMINYEKFAIRFRIALRAKELYLQQKQKEKEKEKEKKDNHYVHFVSAHYVSEGLNEEISSSDISLFVDGRKKPTNKQVDMLAKFLRVDYDWLSGNDVPYPDWFNDLPLSIHDKTELGIIQLGEVVGDTTTVYTAAQSEENHPDQYTQKSTEFSVKLEDTPENDEPLT